MTRPLTDSPWFWLYLFATAGLALLIAIGPKWIQRQTRLESRADGYRYQQDAGAGADRSQTGSVGESGDASAGDVSVGDNPAGDARARSVQRYRGVMAVLALVVAAGWIAFWWTRSNRSSQLLIASNASSFDPSATDEVG